MPSISGDGYIKQLAESCYNSVPNTPTDAYLCAYAQVLLVAADETRKIEDLLQREVAQARDTVCSSTSVPDFSILTQSQQLPEGLTAVALSADTKLTDVIDCWTAVLLSRPSQSGEFTSLTQT